MIALRIHFFSWVEVTSGTARVTGIVHPTSILSKHLRSYQLFINLLEINFIFYNLILIVPYYFMLYFCSCVNYLSSCMLMCWSV